MFSSLQPGPALEDAWIPSRFSLSTEQNGHCCWVWTCHTGPSSAVGTLFCPLWQYAQCLNCMDCVSDFGLVFFFPSLTFLLLVVLSCCSTVSLEINHMVFNLSHCDNNSCLIIFCKNFSFTTAAFQKKSTKNTPKNPTYEKPRKALKKCQCHLNM